MRRESLCDGISTSRQNDSATTSETTKAAPTVVHGRPGPMIVYAATIIGAWTRYRLNDIRPSHWKNVCERTRAAGRQNAATSTSPMQPTNSTLAAASCRRNFPGNRPTTVACDVVSRMEITMVTNPIHLMRWVLFGFAAQSRMELNLTAITVPMKKTGRKTNDVSEGLRFPMIAAAEASTVRINHLLRPATARTTNSGRATEKTTSHRRDHSGTFMERLPKARSSPPITSCHDVPTAIAGAAPGAANASATARIANASTTDAAAGTYNRVSRCG